eukprot:9264352-Heterocapsa_arctica.AAC.1
MGAGDGSWRWELEMGAGDGSLAGQSMNTLTPERQSVSRFRLCGWRFCRLRRAFPRRAASEPSRSQPPTGI